MPGDSPFGANRFRTYENWRTWRRFGREKRPVVNRISPSQLKGYGTIAGRRRKENPRLI